MDSILSSRLHKVWVSPHRGDCTKMKALGYPRGAHIKMRVWGSPRGGGKTPEHKRLFVAPFSNCMRTACAVVRSQSFSAKIYLYAMEDGAWNCQEGN